MTSSPPPGSPWSVEGVRSRAAPYVERAPLPMLEVLGPDHLIGHVNRAFCRLLGKERSELIGKPFAGIVSGGDACLPFLEQVYQTGEHANWTHHEDLENGRAQWLYAMWPALNEEEKPEGVIIQLARTANLCDDLASVNETLLIAGLRQHALTEEAVALNEQLSREMEIRTMLGRRAHLLSETGSRMLRAAPSHDWLSKTLTNVAAELGADTFFCHLVTKEGTVVLENDSGLNSAQRAALQAMLFGEDVRSGMTSRGEGGTPVFGIGEPGSENGRVLRAIGAKAFASYPLRAGGEFYGIASFVSLRRELFDPNDLDFIRTMGDLLAAAMDRQRLFEEAGAAQVVAENANAAKDDFLAALSHELRTPLNPVLLLATEAAADPAIAPELRADFDMIAKNVLLEARLIDDLLDSTRIAHGKLALQMRPLLLREVLHEAIGQVRGDLDLKELTIGVEDDGAVAWVNADPMRLQQVFWNVMKNAVKFTPTGGRITVRTAVDSDGKRLKVRISDTGMGMSAEELARIFDAFSQGDHADVGSGSHRFGGLGLGLAISLRLTEMHQGKISASSAGPGFGTRFTIDLPMIAAPFLPGSQSVETVEATGDSFTETRSRSRVLLVEDHEPTRIVLERLLTLRQFEVATAGTVKEALRVGMSGRFDLLITDIGLPDGSGYEIMEKLGRQGMQGIALTGYGMDDDLEESREAGFFTHLTKPVAIQALEVAVKAALESVAPLRQEAP